MSAQRRVAGTIPCGRDSIAALHMDGAHVGKACARREGAGRGWSCPESSLASSARGPCGRRRPPTPAFIRPPEMPTPPAPGSAWAASGGVPVRVVRRRGFVSRWTRMPPCDGSLAFDLNGQRGTAGIATAAALPWTRQPRTGVNSRHRHAPLPRRRLPLPKTSSALVGSAVHGVWDLGGGRWRWRSGACAENCGNTIDRAAATGLPGCDERVCRAALAAHK